MIGACLLQTGNVLRLLERHVEAKKILDEALLRLGLLQPVEEVSKK